MFHSKNHLRGRLLSLGVLVTAASSAFPVMAQPTERVAPPAQANPAAVKTDQAALDRKLAYFKQKQLLDTRVSLQAKDGTLDEVVKHIKELLPALKVVEVREAKAVKLTFEVESMTADSVLSSAATLAGCDYLVLPEKVVIAPRGKFSREEMIQLIAQRKNSSPMWRLGGVTKEIQQGTGTVPLGNLSLESQETLLQIVANIQAPTSPNPTPNSAVGISTEGKGAIVIDMSSERHRYRIGLPKTK